MTDDGSPGPAPAPAPPTPQKRKSFWRELPGIVITALVISVLIKTFLVQAFYIPSGSMENTLLVDDRVLVNKLADKSDEIHRGDIVVFRDPGNWLNDGPVVKPGGVLGLVRDGGAVSMLGMSHFFQPVDQPISATFMRNVSLHPGVCPSRAYIPELLPALEAGTIDPAVVFTHDLPLDEAARGFAIMDGREEGSIKVALTPGA